MSEFFSWCICIGLFFLGLSVAWHIFWIMIGIIIFIVTWFTSLFDGDE